MSRSRQRKNEGEKRHTHPAIGLLLLLFFFNFPAQGEISLEKSCKIPAVRMSSLAGLGIPASRAEASTQPGVCFKNGILVCTTLVAMTCCLTRSGYGPARPMPPEGQWRRRRVQTAGERRQERDASRSGTAGLSCRWSVANGGTAEVLLLALADVSVGILYSIFGLPPYAAPPAYLST